MCLGLKNLQDFFDKCVRCNTIQDHTFDIKTKLVEVRQNLHEHMIYLEYQNRLKYKLKLNDDDE